MEADPNPFPEFKLFEPLKLIKKVGHALGSLLVPFHCEAPDYMSTHNRGAGPALDRALYNDQPTAE